LPLRKHRARTGKKILDTFLAAKFEGGRHERRVDKLDFRLAPLQLRLRNVDPQIAEAIEHEKLRQQENIELIASEILFRRHFGSARLGVDEQICGRLSPQTLYGGCENIDVIEQLAIDRAKKSSAPNTRTSSRIPAAARTWQFIFPCSNPAIKCSRWI